MSWNAPPVTSRRSFRATNAGLQTWVNNIAGNGARAFILPPKCFDCHLESNDMHIRYAGLSHDLDLALGQVIFTI